MLWTTFFTRLFNLRLSKEYIASSGQGNGWNLIQCLCKSYIFLSISSTKVTVYFPGQTSSFTILKKVIFWRQIGKTLDSILVQPESECFTTLNLHIQTERNNWYCIELDQDSFYFIGNLNQLFLYPTNICIHPKDWPRQKAMNYFKHTQICLSWAWTTITFVNRNADCECESNYRWMWMYIWS